MRDKQAHTRDTSTHLANKPEQPQPRSHSTDYSSPEQPSIGKFTQSEVLHLQRTIGNAATRRHLNAGNEASMIQRDTATSIKNPGITVTPIITPDELSDEQLAEGIMDLQHSILVGWEGALARFDKVMTSESDKAGKPNFKKTLASFIEDNMMKTFTSKIPGAEKVFDLLGKLKDEAKRASGAQESANLRDFFVAYNDDITKMKQWVLRNTAPFKASVTRTHDEMLRTDDTNEYSIMRMGLVEKYQGLEAIEQAAKPEQLFMTMTEHWLRGSKSDYDQPAWIGILVNDDYSVRSAQIHGPGGQKLAEQLKKDSPNGVDVYNMDVPRQIAYYPKGKSYPIFIRLDENGRLKNDGIAIEGDYMPVYKTIRARGLAPTKNVSGD